MTDDLVLLSGGAVHGNQNDPEETGRTDRLAARIEPLPKKLGLVEPLETRRTRAETATHTGEGVLNGER